jgi:hypothetical protein
MLRGIVKNISFRKGRVVLTKGGIINFCNRSFLMDLLDSVSGSRCLWELIYVKCTGSSEHIHIHGTWQRLIFLEYDAAYVVRSLVTIDQYK